MVCRLPANRQEQVQVNLARRQIGRSFIKPLINEEKMTLEEIERLLKIAARILRFICDLLKDLKDRK